MESKPFEDKMATNSEENGKNTILQQKLESERIENEKRLLAEKLEAERIKNEKSLLAE